MTHKEFTEEQTFLMTLIKDLQKNWIYRRTEFAVNYVLMRSWNAEKVHTWYRYTLVIGRQTCYRYTDYTGPFLHRKEAYAYVYMNMCVCIWVSDILRSYEYDAAYEHTYSCMHTYRWMRTNPHILACTHRHLCAHKQLNAHTQLYAHLKQEVREDKCVLKDMSWDKRLSAKTSKRFVKTCTPCAHRYT